MATKEAQKETHLWFKKFDRRDWSAITRAILNIGGALFFSVGSAFLVGGSSIAGSWLFCFGNVCFVVSGFWWCAVSYANYQYRYSSGIHHRLELVVAPGSVAPPFVELPPIVEAKEILHAFKALTALDIFAAICQIMGGLWYNGGLAVSAMGDFDDVAISLYIVGSTFFFLQGVLGHIMSVSLTGPLLGLWPRYKFYNMCMLGLKDYDKDFCCMKSLCLHRCVPSAFLNTCGSFLFVVGSVFLFYDNTIFASGLGYLAGSLCFIPATGTDFVNLLDSFAKRAITDKIL